MERCWAVNGSEEVGPQPEKANPPERNRRRVLDQPLATAINVKGNTPAMDIAATSRPEDCRSFGDFIEDTDEARWLDINGAFGLYVAGRDDDETEQHQEGRLFATAAELGVPPVSPRDADLSTIRVTAPATIEEYNRLHAELEVTRAERKAKRDRIEGAGDLSRLGAL